MKRCRLILQILSVAALVFIVSCGAGSDKRKIENTMREYVERGLNEDETFDFVGLSNHRYYIYGCQSSLCRRDIHHSQQFFW